MLDCSLATHEVTQRFDGKWFEYFKLPGQAWENEISGPNSATRTPASEVLANWGVCQKAQPIQSTTLLPPPTPNTSDVGTFAGVIMIASAAVVVVGSCVFGAILSYRWKPARVLPSASLQVLAPSGNSSNGIPEVEPTEFEGNSSEFEGNSQEALSANSLGIPDVSADSQVWPPKSMGAPFDANEPEQPGEFETYRKYVDADGLNPRGNDIIKTLWGVTPGRSGTYEAARKRRDDFAKRLSYYRYEEA